MLHGKLPLCNNPLHELRILGRKNPPRSLNAKSIRKSPRRSSLPRVDIPYVGFHPDLNPHRFSFGGRRIKIHRFGRTRRRVYDHCLCFKDGPHGNGAIKCCAVEGDKARARVRESRCAAVRDFKGQTEDEPSKNHDRMTISILCQIGEMGVVLLVA